MFSAELEPHTQTLVPRRSVVEHFENIFFSVLANGAERPT